MRQLKYLWLLGLLALVAVPSFCQEDDFEDADIEDEMADEPPVEDLKVPQREKVFQLNFIVLISILNIQCVLKLA